VLPRPDPLRYPSPALPIAYSEQFPFPATGKKVYCIEALAKLEETVTPAKAGVHKSLKNQDSCFSRNDVEGLLQEAL
jgi:hypothetical protein